MAPCPVRPLPRQGSTFYYALNGGDDLPLEFTGSRDVVLTVECLLVLDSADKDQGAGVNIDRSTRLPVEDA